MLGTLTQKVSLAVALFLVALAAVGTAALLQVQGNAAVSLHLTDHTTPFALASGQFHLHLARAFTEAESFVREGDADSRAEAVEEREAAAAALATLTTLADDTHTTLEETTSQAELYQRQAAFLAASERVIDAVIDARAGGDAAGLEAALDDLESLEEGFGGLERDASALVAQVIDSASGELNGRNRRALLFVPLAFGLLGLLALGALWFLRRAVVAPLLALSASTRQVAAGDLSPQVAVTSRDEIGDLQRSFNTMTVSLLSQREALRERELTLTMALAEVERRAAAQTALLAEVQQQQAVIAGLSVPLLPIAGDTLVMPLVGALDQARLSQVQASALGGVERTRARRLILDITGVPMVDPQLARGLLDVAAAVRLLGARVLLVGVQPETAQGIVSAGVSLEEVVTYRDLAAAVAG